MLASSVIYCIHWTCSVTICYEEEIVFVFWKNAKHCILCLIQKHDSTVLLQIALYIWDSGKGLHLTAVPELCTEPEDSPRALHCATTLSKEPPLCVSICSVTPSLPLSSNLGKWNWSKTEWPHKTVRYWQPWDDLHTTFRLPAQGWLLAAPAFHREMLAPYSLACYCFYVPISRTWCIKHKNKIEVLALSWHIKFSRLPSLKSFPVAEQQQITLFSELHQLFIYQNIFNFLHFFVN